MKRTPLKRKTPLRAKKRLDPYQAVSKRIAKVKLKRTSRLAPRSKKNKKRPRNIPYMLWIKTLPCAVCGWMGSEAAHTGPRGLGQKSPDEQCIPLCPDHHRHRKDALDVAGPRRFTTLHQIEIPRLVAQLNSIWGELQKELVMPRENTEFAKTRKLGYV